MKILLIQPPLRHLYNPRIAPPLGLLYLSSYVKELYCDAIPDLYVKVVDMNLEMEMEDYDNLDKAYSVLDNYLDFDLYGFTVQSPQYFYVKQFVSYLNKHCKNKDAMFCLGGPHITSLSKQSLNDTRADIAVTKEGIETFGEIVGKFWMDGWAGIYEAPIKGAVIKYGSQFIDGGVRDYIKDLDSIPFPDRNQLNFSKYTRTIQGEPATTIITTLGCIGKCIFCQQSQWGKKVRYRSVENIIKEIDLIYDQFGIKHILFLDDTFTLNRKRIMGLLPELEKRYKERGSRWRGWTRVDVIDQELLHAMKRAGFYALCFGVESGSQRILDVLRKGTTVEMNKRAIEMCRKAGIYARVSFMVGNPTETQEDLNKTVDFIIQNKPDDWLLSTFTPIVGTDVWDDPDKFGMIIGDIDDYKEYYIVGYDERSGSIAQYKHISLEELQRRRDWVHDLLIEQCPRKDIVT